MTAAYPKHSLWLCVDLPMLPLECFTRGNCNTGSPLIVSKDRIVCCYNQQAEQQGIRNGMSLSTALALCPSLKSLERRHEQEQRLLLNLADWCYRFTPVVSLQAPGSLLLETGTCLRLFHGLEPLLARLSSGLHEQGVSPVLAVAPTPAAASLFATAKQDRKKDWSRYCNAQSGETDQAAFLKALEELPLSLLPASKQQRQQMQRTGFQTLGDLFALSATALGRRFGKPFNQQLARIRGDLHDPRPIQEPMQCFNSEVHLLDSIDKREQLLAVMETLLHELARFLYRRQAVCQTLHWKLQFSNGQNGGITLRCSGGYNNPLQLLQLTALQLETLSLPNPVTEVALSCNNFTVVQPESAALSPELALPTQRQNDEASLLLLDRLRVRLGEERLYGLTVRNQHLPEQSWAKTSAPPSASETARIQHTIPRPSWLLPQPQRLRQTDSLPHWHGRIRLLRGPERLESNYWQVHPQRDYYIAQHENNALYWMYRDKLSGQWFLQGVFG